jgi:hypothetical protein
MISVSPSGRDSAPGHQVGNPAEPGPPLLLFKQHLVLELADHLVASYLSGKRGIRLHMTRRSRPGYWPEFGNQLSTTALPPAQKKPDVACDIGFQLIPTKSAKRHKRKRWACCVFADSPAHRPSHLGWLVRPDENTIMFRISICIVGSAMAF